MVSPLLLHPKIVEETGPIQFLWGLHARTIGDPKTYKGSTKAAMSRLEQHILSFPGCGDKPDDRVGCVNQGYVSWCYFMHIRRSDDDHVVIKKEVPRPVRGKCRVGRYNK